MSHGRCLLLLTLSVCVLYRPTIVTGQSSANGAQMTLHVLKITGGPAGTESNGSFVFTEERSVFSRSSDRDVFVMFQWDGTPGPHKLVAQWRSPDGGLTSTSSIDYVASSRRFGAYWQLNITTSMPLGMWSVEATVDGQPAGRFTFEIKDEAVQVTEKEIVTFVTWQAQARLKGQTVLRLYDDANRLVGESKPGKTDLRKNQLMFSSWRLPVPPTPGLYRADVNFDGQPMWRGFVRIAP